MQTTNKKHKLTAYLSGVSFLKIAVYNQEKNIDKGNTMTNTISYNVVLTGNIRSGFEADIVTQKFAELFKLSPQKAAAVVGTERVLKQGISQDIANTYQKKLHGIGLEVDIQKNQPQPKTSYAEPTHAANTDNPDALALVPVEQDVDETATTEQPVACPKCGSNNISNGECQDCGIFIHKYQQMMEQKAIAEQTKKDAAAAKLAELKASQTGTNTETNQPTNNTAKQAASVSATTGVADNRQTASHSSQMSNASDYETNDELSPVKQFALPALAALIGALVWYGIAVAFNYELGLIAWLIGGAVGFAASMMGTRGDTAGLICGALVALSIFGGKYMTAISFKAEYVEQVQMMSTGNEELQAAFEMEMDDARVFSESVVDEASLKQFMVQYEYSDASSAKKVSTDEVKHFRETTQKRLETLLTDQPDIQTWQTEITNALSNVSTFDIFKEGMDWKVFLFLFFGIGTAYKMARGEE